MHRLHTMSLLIHTLLTIAVAIVLVLVNIITGHNTLWAIWPIWGLLGLLAAHAGLVAMPKHRLLGMWIGGGLTLIAGLILIDLAHDGTPWWFWPAGVWVVLTALFVGLGVDLLAMVPGTHTTPREEPPSLPE